MTFEFDASGKLKTPSAQELEAADAELDIIVLDEGTLEDGTPYWAYIAIKPTKYQRFIEMTRHRQPIALEEYGEIVKHGFDPEVPLVAREEMKRDYEFDELYIEKLGERLKEAQTAFLKQKEAQRIGDIVAMLKKQGPK